jgi:hypothetical protein
LLEALAAGALAFFGAAATLRAPERAAALAAGFLARGGAAGLVRLERCLLAELLEAFEAFEDFAMFIGARRQNAER